MSSSTIVFNEANIATFPFGRSERFVFKFCSTNCAKAVELLNKEKKNILRIRTEKEKCDSFQ
jgi:hypothetical protein